MIQVRDILVIAILGVVVTACSESSGGHNRTVNSADTTGVNEATLQRHIAGCRGNAEHANRIIRNAISENEAVAKMEALPTYPETLSNPDDRRLANYICAALAAGELRAREDMRHTLRSLR